MKRFNSKTFLMCLTVCLMTNSIVAQHDLFYQETVDDLPTEEDLEYYLDVLEKAIEFCLKFERHIDMNLQYGLFMVDVNLRHFLEKELPKDMIIRLKNIFVKTDELKDFLQSAMQHKEVPELEKIMTTIFQNASDWLGPDPFTTDLLNVTTAQTIEELVTIYGKYEDYYNQVFDFSIYKPTPEESDECLLQLLKGSTVFLRSWPNCVAPAHCRNVMKNGSDFGYGLTHRLLFMNVAHFYRRCVVFEEAEDKERVIDYCTKAFNEAQFIAKNYFEMLDLMAEQITLCTVMGHSQFLRNYWLKTIVQFQTPDGCFFQQIMQVENNTVVEIPIETSEENLKKKCHLHFTAVSVGTVSSALRYILETGRFQ